MQVGRYRLIERLAVGGMAEVFLATAGGDQGFEKPVVIKRMLAQHADSPQFNQMFLDEARIMLSLVHANVVQILDLGNMDGLPFLCLEFVHGRDLGSVLERAVEQGTPLPLPLAVHIAREVARALEYAHNKADRDGRPLNIIHRDVNPSNIFLSFEGAVKVGDFGLAKAKDNVAKTEAGVVKGKISYMSPEQVTGLGIDQRSDIFSLGATLYEMTVGERPFAGNSPFQIVPLIAEGRYPLPTSKVSDYDTALESIVKRSLERDRDRRYGSAEELKDDLGRYLSRFTIGERHLSAFLGALFDADERRPPSLEAPGRSGTPALVHRATGEYVSMAGPLAAPPPPPTAPPPPAALVVSSLQAAPPRPAAPAPAPPRPPAAEIPPATTPAPVPFVQVQAPRPGAPQPHHAYPESTPAPKRSGGTLAVVLALLIGGALIGTAWLRPWERMAQTASVKVVSTPGGASILLDGKPTGQSTPATLDGLQTGRSYVVELKHPEGSSPARLFEPTRAETYALSFDLKRLDQSLAIASAPAGATVKVDGEARGQTPVVLKLNRGRSYKVEVLLEGHEPVVREHTAGDEVGTMALVLTPLKDSKDKVKGPRGGSAVAARPGAAAATPAAAAPAAGLPLAGRGEPAGTLELEGSERGNVFIDGKLAGHMPGFRLRLRPGSYQLRVVLTGSKMRHEARVEVKANKTWKLHLQAPAP